MVSKDNILMHGDMNPTNWGVLDWIKFLLGILAPTMVVVAWIVMMVTK